MGVFCFVYHNVFVVCLCVKEQRKYAQKDNQTQREVGSVGGGPENIAWSPGENRRIQRRTSRDVKQLTLP